MKTIAVLDNDKRLVGYKQVDRIEEEDIVVPNNCDLQATGRYRWTGREFLPCGYGFGKPIPPSTIKEKAIYLMMKALTNDTPIPAECREWVKWYEENVIRKEEEYKKGGTK